MKRLVLIPAILLAVGCEKTEIHLPPTAAASAPNQSYPSASIIRDVAEEAACRTPGSEEFEGMVSLFGRTLKARRQMILNTNGDYVRHGKAVAWFESGQKAGEMSFHDDKPHGKQHIWHENGRKKLHGEWSHGLASGTWIEWYDNGQKKSEGAYHDGKQHGRWSYFEDDGAPAGVTMYNHGQETVVAQQPTTRYNK